MRLGVEKLIFIGNLVMSEGLQPDPWKISAINNMAKPETKQDIQQFLGMVTLFGKVDPWAVSDVSIIESSGERPE